MVYQIRLNDDDTWDLVDPDGKDTSLTGQPMPVDYNDAALWETMWSHASSNGFFGDAVNTIHSTFDRIDNRTNVDHSPE